MHLCIQRLNEKQIYTKEKIEQMIQDLVLKEIITDTEAKAIDKEKTISIYKIRFMEKLDKSKRNTQRTTILYKHFSKKKYMITYKQKKQY